MTALLFAELLKLRTLRLPWILGGLAVAISGLVGFAVVRMSIDAGQPLHLSLVAGAPAQALWFLAIVSAVLATAGEFHHRTVRSTLLAAPRRGRVLLAKGTVAGAYGGMLVVLGGASAAAAGMVSAARSGVSFSPVNSWGSLAGAVAVGALFAVLATGLGTITRSTAAAIGAVLLWRFAGEALLPMLLHDDRLTRWTPNGAAEALLGLGSAPLAPWAAGVVLAGYAVAVCGIATVLFLRRDPA
ncbi:MAG TPA: hypothetical protein VFJ97_13130 [Dermatophilaceae bacterium]|nr:hypothetical protein [Dermatophilaceae bacterium]